MPPVPRRGNNDPRNKNAAGGTTARGVTSTNAHDDHPGASRPVAAAPAPRGNPAGQWKTLTPPSTNRQTPQGARLTQQWLNQHAGANLIVDGIWGPRSQAAYNAYTKRAGIQTPPKTVKPPPPAAGGRTTPPPSTAPRVPQTAAAPPPPPPPPQAPGLDQLKIAGRSIPDIVAQIMAGNGLDNVPQTQAQHVDPLSYAASMAQLQFGPQIAEAQRQMGATQGQLAPTLANISKSFAPALAQAQAATQANQATAGGAQATQDGTAAALASLPGMSPDVARAVGDNANIGKTLLAQQAQAQAGLDQAQQTDVQNLTGQYQGQATNQTNQAVDGLRGNLLDAVAQRANSLPANIVQAMQMNDQFRSNATSDNAQQMNTLLASKLAGPQITASRLGNVNNAAGLLEQLVNDQFQRGVTTHQQGIADQQAMDTHATTILDNRLKNLQATWAGQDRANANAPVPFYKVTQDPKTAQALANALWSGGLVNPNTGGLAQGVDPGNAYTTILTRLKSQFPSADKTRLANWAKGQVMPFAQRSGWIWKSNGFRQVGGTATG